MDFTEPFWIAESAEDFELFNGIFIQRHPRYGKKPLGPDGTWTMKNKALHDAVIKDHLNGNYYVGSLAQWYMRFGSFDIDDRTREEAEEIRARVGMNEKNSMLFSSQSVNSWHLHFRPLLNGQPPPVTRFHNAFRLKARENKIEIYPQKNRIFRLPFGYGQEYVDRVGGHLLYQTEQLHEFLKLEPYDISQLEAQQEFDFQGRTIGQGLIIPVFDGGVKRGQYLYENGLQGPRTRQGENAQWDVARFLFQDCNLPPDAVVREVYRWIKTKHNGFSRDIIKYPNKVKYEIREQVKRLYNYSYYTRTYPNAIHNGHNGYISKPDLAEIIEATGGSIPRARFLFHLVKHYYPRRYRQFVAVHRDRFVEWGAQRTYGKYLNELEDKGLVKRGAAYSVGRFAKAIDLKWDFKPSTKAVLIEGRSIDTFQDYVKFTVENPRDFRELLQAKGAKRTTALEAVRGIYS